MKDLFLSMPSKEYKKSFEDYVIAYKNADDNYYLKSFKIIYSI